MSASRSRTLDRLLRNRSAVIGFALVVLVVAFSALAPAFVKHDPNVPDFEHGIGPFGSPVAPSRVHLFGTDTIFRDLFVRLAHGGRLSLAVASLATIIATVLGTGIGIAAGWLSGSRVRADRVVDGVAALAVIAGLFASAAGAERWSMRWLAAAATLLALGVVIRAAGTLVTSTTRARASLTVYDFACLPALGVVLWAIRRIELAPATSWLATAAACAADSAIENVATRAPSQGTGRWYLTIDWDDLLMRIVDVLLAFPILLLLMALAAAIDRTSFVTMLWVLGLTAWTSTARLVRSKTLQLREMPYVQAARALGQTTARVLRLHVLPGLTSLLIVIVSNSIAAMIVAESALAFLGLSVPPPQASWGRMLEEARPYASAAPWLLVAPASALLIAVLGFNLLGEGLRDALDPQD